MESNAGPAYYHPYAMQPPPAAWSSPVYRPTSAAIYGAVPPACSSQDPSTVFAIDQQQLEKERLQKRLDELNKEVEAKEKEINSIRSREERTMLTTLKEIRTYEWHTDELNKDLRRANGKVGETRRLLDAKDAEIEALSEQNAELLSKKMRAREAVRKSSPAAMRMTKAAQQTSDKTPIVGNSGSTPGHHQLPYNAPPTGYMQQCSYSRF